MLTHAVTDARAWRAAAIEDRRSWYHPLSQRSLAALDETLGQLRRQPRPATELRVSETPCAGCEAVSSSAGNSRVNVVPRLSSLSTQT